MHQEVVVKLAWTEDQVWRQKSACLGWAPDRAKDSPDKIPDDPFFALSAKSQRKAAEFCKEVCPVMIECGKYALDKDERQGVWGGMTERDLLRMRKAEQRTQQQQTAKLSDQLLLATC